MWRSTYCRLDDLRIVDGHHVTRFIQWRCVVLAWSKQWSVDPSFLVIGLLWRSVKQIRYLKVQQRLPWCRDYYYHHRGIVFLFSLHDLTKRSNEGYSIALKSYMYMYIFIYAILHITAYQLIKFKYCM